MDPKEVVAGVKPFYDPKKDSSSPFFKKPSRVAVLKGIKTFLLYIGEDPDREGLNTTPSRFLRAWEEEWGLGYNAKFRAEQIKSIIGGQFGDGKEDYDAMVVVKDIPFTSHCEHHIAIFTGTVDIGYIPAEQGGKILGLSKPARIVDLFSKRLQVQERMTCQIANYIMKAIKPQGVGVIVYGVHSCMCSRGVKKPGSSAITSAMKGCFQDLETKSEFLKLVGR